MINFKKLVNECFLIEQDALDKAKLTLEQYLTSDSFPLKSVFENYFNPEEFNYSKDINGNLAEIISRAHYIAGRIGTTGAETSFERAEKGTPLIDFLLYFSNAYFTQQKPEKNKQTLEFGDRASIISDKNIRTKQFPISILDNIAKSFIQEFKEKNTAAPKTANSFREYKPITATIQDLQAKYFGKKGDELIGKLALSNYDNFSIKKTIYGLLEVRKQIRAKQIKDESIPNAIDFIDDILLNPEKYAGAKNVVPEKFKKIYQDVHVTKLIEITDAAKKLFESEAIRNGKSANINEVFPNKVATTYNDFLDNKLENDTFIFNFKTSEVDVGISLTPEKVEDLPGGYTIKNIKDSLKSVSESRTQAATLIQRLEAFANYVRDEASRDIIGGVKDLAQGFKAIAGGVPWLGSR